MSPAFSDIAFTPSVKARQTEEGSRAAYARLELDGVGVRDLISPAEAAFIEARDGFYQATVSETGWPYVQFRGGPAGFLKVLDDRTLAYADFRGNRQYISSGNMTGNDRVCLFLMDYPARQRLKIWARARQLPARDNPELIRRLQPEGYRALPERAVLLTVEAYDWNCPAHIPQRFTRKDLEPQLELLRRRINELENENAELKDFLATRA